MQGKARILPGGRIVIHKIRLCSRRVTLITFI